MAGLTESVVEDAALAWLESLGYAIKHGPDISPAGDTLTLALSQKEREDYSEVVLGQRLREALVRLNPTLPAEAIDDAFRKIIRLESVDSVIEGDSFRVSDGPVPVRPGF